MTAIGAKATGAGASSHTAQMWDQANWSHIEAEVKRLQVRIAKATREGRWGKVQALQRLLTRSHSGKMLAVKIAIADTGSDAAVKEQPDTEMQSHLGIGAEIAQNNHVGTMHRQSLRILLFYVAFAVRAHGRARKCDCPDSLWILQFSPRALFARPLILAELKQTAA
jgi:hypothetical protein